MQLWIVPALLKHLGWRGSCKFLGVITMLCGIAAYLVIRDRLRAKNLLENQFALRCFAIE